MASDLPYFKFVISEWNDGDITTCSFEAQGLFVNLCSKYWSREGKLILATAKRMFPNCSATAWGELIDGHIIKIQDDKIVINFLDEQLEERGKVSVVNSQNAAKGWEKRKSNATALPDESERINPACNKEERREEKNRTEKKRKEKKGVLIPFDADLLAAWNDWVVYRKEKNKTLTPSTIKKQIQFLGARGSPEAIKIINTSIEKGWTGLFEINENERNKRTSGANGTLRNEDHEAAF
jgi:hypothetical protein